ncbi:GNAT family N-acetyltransferase [Streptomyces sp. NRRL S-118]|uniref:GNAT family N-acetyltransferase n=1 Tax=Streptomyces sp. NRRL S-118 TaxID=1463881 RepID=UPI001F358B41|nr:GNAT family N-acetyltransferase [Streptomyces sp. NRRL S-118]
MQGHHAHAMPTAPRPLPWLSAGRYLLLPRRRPKHRRPTPVRGRWHRRVLAYRDVTFETAAAPAGPEAQCLLLVHIRQVVGQVTFRVCETCSAGLITGVAVDERFRSSGLGTRALSHLRSRYPDVSWHTTLQERATRDLFRRMRIPTTATGPACPHTDAHREGLQLKS